MKKYFTLFGILTISLTAIFSGGLAKAGMIFPSSGFNFPNVNIEKAHILGKRESSLSKSKNGLDFKVQFSGLAIPYQGGQPGLFTVIVSFSSYADASAMARDALSKNTTLLCNDAKSLGNNNISCDSIDTSFDEPIQK